MLSLSYLALALTATIASAQPTLEKREPSLDATSSTLLMNYFQVLGNHVEVIRDTSDGPPSPPPCQVGSGAMPTISATTSALASATPGLTVSNVAIGRGTQNYTCVNNTSDAAPVAIGATANLYNATCIAANYPDLLAMIPDIALQFDTPTGDTALLPSELLLMGIHYFSDNTTPSFDLNVPGTSLGVIHAAKKGSQPAPSSSTPGQDGQGFGSVPWLQLQRKSGDADIQEVYRINTAGGQPPMTCEDMPSAFEVDYAAEYGVPSSTLVEQY
ncbi:MAG: hypothetical protein M1838_005489 [Thelocarpon superellum]|nr:MAG: hypothetical protein M1838_005489 [Thelocarpon superellum]